MSQGKDIFFNSYVAMGILVSGIVGMTLAFVGCCTSKVKDKCCITCFSLLLLVFFAIFLVIGFLMMAIHLKSHNFIQNFCAQSSMFDSEITLSNNTADNFMVKVGRAAEGVFFQTAQETFGEIDEAF